MRWIYFRRECIPRTLIEPYVWFSNCGIAISARFEDIMYPQAVKFYQVAQAFGITDLTKRLMRAFKIQLREKAIDWQVKFHNVNPVIQPEFLTEEERRGSSSHMTVAEGSSMIRSFHLSAATPDASDGPEVPSSTITSHASRHDENAKSANDNHQKHWQLHYQ